MSLAEIKKRKAELDAEESAVIDANVVELSEIKQAAKATAKIIVSLEKELSEEKEITETLGLQLSNEKENCEKYMADCKAIEVRERTTLDANAKLEARIAEAEGAARIAKDALEAGHKMHGEMEKALGKRLDTMAAEIKAIASRPIVQSQPIAVKREPMEFDLQVTGRDGADNISKVRIVTH